MLRHQPSHRALAKRLPPHHAARLHVRIAGHQGPPAAHERAVLRGYCLGLEVLRFARAQNFRWETKGLEPPVQVTTSVAQPEYYRLWALGRPSGQNSVAHE